MPGSCPGFLTNIERTMAADTALVMVRPTASKYSVFIFFCFGLYTVLTLRWLHPPENFFVEKICCIAESALCHKSDSHNDKIDCERFHKFSAMV
ncbi:MAG: hypothetical protein A2W93_09260 [Bacteroidetes bacterium GWF2_43_63]|nr:MAG: hypothetical protein A2W94_05640 [Bacteroidetes bacterium GWE2_42_42]OFY54485.1 MAG: hypothetical protein A2W93_09260 [Bacteroidetes bacterium GWF2_43_63]HBG70433.1 hypothetical protein [Bacteroidales bacterium]HCB63450.1 hypothetical protein [Bacteroidales bacterium]